MAAGARWETDFARQRWPLMVGAVGRSLLATAPQDHRRVYYRALAATFSHAARGRGVTPVERHLSEELWVRYGGLEYLLTPESSFGYYLHAFEPRTARDLLGRRGRVFLDGGANTGQYSVPLARRFERVIAVEPNPVAASILRRNVERNHLTNVSVVERLILPERGRATLYAGDVLTTWGTVTPSDRKVEVEAVTLDDLVAEHGPVDLVKLDIEGCEADVILSARLLARVGALSFSGFPGDLERVRGPLRDAGFTVRRPEPLFRSVENFIAERRGAAAL